jgi:hypothetical protein
MEERTGSTDMKTMISAAPIADLKINTDLDSFFEIAKNETAPAKVEPVFLAQSEAAIKSKRREEEKIALVKIASDLENVRLNLTDSVGQGFLINASATIISYISRI